VDHSILLTVLKNIFGVQEGILEWLRSYLTGHSQSVSASSGCSEATDLTCVVLQGSVLGPVKFIAYTEDLHAIMYRFSICHHSFADDTQLLKAVLLADVNLACRCLECCIIDIWEWCAQRSLQLNTEMTEVI